MKTKPTIFTFLIVLSFTLTFAQPGVLDGDFHADGKVITPITNVNDYGSAVVIQPDSKILVTGSSGFDGITESSNFATIRYNIDGSLDNSFGENGIVVTDMGRQEIGSSIALQPDGKIVVGGTSNVLTAINTFAIVRYNQDGTIDNSFSTVNSDGVLIGPFGDCNAIAIQEDGKILAAGNVNISTEDFIVARYNTDGTIDNTFGVNGVVITDIGGGIDRGNSIAIKPNGHIIVVGESHSGEDLDFAIVCYKPNGELDNNFSVDGIVTTAVGHETDRAESVAIQQDGKIVVGGFKGGHFAPGFFAMARYFGDGTLDNSFGLNGKVTTDLGAGNSNGGRSVVIQEDGKIIVSGQAKRDGFEKYDFALVRYDSNGSPDTSFGTEGIVRTDFGHLSESSSFACAVQPNGRIVIVGYAREGSARNNFAVARYLSGSNLGVISFSKQEHGLLIYPNPLQESAMIEYTLTNDEIISIDLYNVSGNLIQNFIREKKRARGQHKEKLNLETSIPSGIYILTLSNGEGSSSVRVVK